MVVKQQLLNLGFVARHIVSTVGKVVVMAGVAVAMAEAARAAIHPSHPGCIAVFAEGDFDLEVEIG